MRVVLYVGVCLAAAGCGRYRFDDKPKPDAPHCAASVGAPASAPLTCSQVARFEVGAICVDAITAVSTPSGITMFTIDSVQNLAAWVYDTAAGTATAQFQIIDDGVSGPLGAAVMGTDLVVVANHASGTKVFALDDSFALRAPPTSYPGSAAIVPIARSGIGGELAIATVESKEIWVRGVSATGVESVPAVKLVEATEIPSYVSLIPAGTGYLLGWIAAVGSPNAARLALLDASFGIVAGPVTANVTTFDPINPQVAWAPTSNAYLVTWFEKTPTGSDDVWIATFDGALQPIGTPVRLAEQAANARVASDGIDFWVTWKAGSTLATARVTPAGAITPQVVPNGGGKPRTWQMFEAPTRARLVWSELDGDGGDLWFQEMCP